MKASRFDPREQSSSKMKGDSNEKERDQPAGSIFVNSRNFCLVGGDCLSPMLRDRNMIAALFAAGRRTRKRCAAASNG
ncbi:MAG TPA: hypothetical protein VFB82_01230, partial [Blastocatellia bacterium]|nr:hypothetical protein [Blastocatellia bacterium]